MSDEQRPMPGIGTYLVIYAALMALLVVTVAAAFVPWNRLLPGRGWGVAVALTIAVAKGLLILLYFMHAKYSDRMVWAFAGAGFLWLGILFTLTFSDYITRNHPAGVNPKGEPRLLEASRGSGKGTDDGRPRPREHSPREAGWRADQ